MRAVGNHGGGARAGGRVMKGRGIELDYTYRAMRW